MSDDEQLKVLCEKCIYFVASDVYTDQQSVDCEMCSDNGVWIASSFVLKYFCCMLSQKYSLMTVLLCIAVLCSIHTLVTVLFFQSAYCQNCCSRFQFTL
jgi:hypothetical protein